MQLCEKKTKKQDESIDDEIVQHCQTSSSFLLVSS